MLHQKLNQDHNDHNDLDGDKLKSNYLTGWNKNGLFSGAVDMSDQCCSHCQYAVIWVSSCLEFWPQSIKPIHHLLRRCLCDPALTYRTSNSLLWCCFSAPWRTWATAWLSRLNFIMRERLVYKIKHMQYLPELQTTVMEHTLTDVLFYYYRKWKLLYVSHYLCFSIPSCPLVSYQTPGKEVS